MQLFSGPGIYANTYVLPETPSQPGRSGSFLTAEQVREMGIACEHYLSASANDPEVQAIDNYYPLRTGKPGVKKYAENDSQIAGLRKGTTICKSCTLLEMRRIQSYPSPQETLAFPFDEAR